MMSRTFSGNCLVPGVATGSVLYADVSLSFMGGVNAATGEIIDTHHPLHGKNVADKILAIPSGRGSCAGSLSIFELLMGGVAPKALVFCHPEAILTLGVLIAREFFERGIPVLRVNPGEFARLEDAKFASIHDDRITLSETPLSVESECEAVPDLDLAAFKLSELDRRFLDGEFGPAVQIATRIIIRAAQMEDADSLIDIDMAHIDGCFYQGPGGVAFARRLRDLGAAVRVPSSMNALCVDRRQWRGSGVSDAIGAPSDILADLYVEMGVKPTYTCAPYLLDTIPAFGQQIAWAESNAVVFANSVLGARTMKYPDYLDILIAITGRAPNADCHVDAKRLATVKIDVECPQEPDDAFFPALGYHVGKIATNDIPLVCGLENLTVTRDNLKAFGAAFATTSAAPMFHILGITPEAVTVSEALMPASGLTQTTVTKSDLRQTWMELNTASSEDVDLVSLGNPHFSLTEIEALAGLCQGKLKAKGVNLVVTCGREVYDKAITEGYVEQIRRFGGTFMTDTCWCLIGEPIVASTMRNVMTNSGKYAHYGPAAVRKGFHFNSLAKCVEAAVSGRADMRVPTF